MLQLLASSYGRYLVQRICNHTSGGLLQLLASVSQAYGRRVVRRVGILHAEDLRDNIADNYYRNVEDLRGAWLHLRAVPYLSLRYMRMRNAEIRTWIGGTQGKFTKRQEGLGRDGWSGAPWNAQTRSRVGRAARRAWVLQTVDSSDSRGPRAEGRGAPSRGPRAERRAPPSKGGRGPQQGRAAEGAATKRD